jgi:hypothetical protein
MYIQTNYIKITNEIVPYEKFEITIIHRDMLIKIKNNYYIRNLIRLI